MNTTGVFFCPPRQRGPAPRNGSFQSFVTALKLQLGEDAAREWLEGMKDNDAREYPKQRLYRAGGRKR